MMMDGYKENELEGIEMQIIEVKKKLGDYKEDDKDEGDKMDDF